MGSDHRICRRSVCQSLSMKKTNLAWAAGFLDGEGHFRATRVQIVTRKNGKKGIKSYSYFQIAVVQSHLAVLNRLKRIIGGAIQGPYHYPPSKPYWSMVVCTNAEKVFKKLFPYLSIVKRAQGKAAISQVIKRNARLERRLDKELYDDNAS